MTSKIIVNNIESDSGISSITFNDSIFIGDINSTGTSTFNVVSGVSTIGVTTVHLTGINDLNYPTAGPLSNRNLIMNGAMRISQRATSSTSFGYNTVDRFRSGLTGSTAAITSSQSSDSPAGFSNSFRMDVDTTDTLTGTDEFYFEQRVEAQNLQHLDYGTSSAKTLTLSFWVKSYQTGQFSVWFYQDDSTRAYFKEYTVNASGTWEYKTVTIPGDASGVINDDNGYGLAVRFYLGGGSDREGTVSTDWALSVSGNRFTSNQVQVTNNTDNYWAITGIQLETGSVATPFEHINYGDDLARCQRYYQGVDTRNDSSGYQNFGLASWPTAAKAYCTMSFQTEMRAPPTSIDVSAGNTFYVNSGSTAVTNFTSATFNIASRNSGIVSLDGGSGGTNGRAGRWLNNNNNTAYCYFSAEL